jgi:hypothetical protein
MDMDLVVANCSHRRERLRVHARSHGPCPFPHPVDHAYSLPAQSDAGVRGIGAVAPEGDRVAL